MKLHSIFHSIQTEGVFAGTPAVFIRTQGCPICCPFCDTKEAQGRIDLEASLPRLQSFMDEHRNARMVVVTGGEPLWQPDLEKWLQWFRNYGTVQIETSGAQMAVGCKPFSNFYVMISPKKDSDGNYLTLCDWLVRDNYTFFKILYEGKEKEGQIYEFMEKWDLSFPYVYIQPLLESDIYSEVSKENIRNAVEFCKTNNFKLSVQSHKFLGFE